MATHSLLHMRIRLFVLLLFLLALPISLQAKTHTVALGVVHHEPYVAPGTAAKPAGEAATLKVRALLVDGVQKEWTTGDVHDVTDRTFMVRRAFRLNDALPGEAARMIWQSATWLMVDRASGHITALHLPDFDPAVSDVVWYRDYAAYCGVHETATMQTLVAVVAQAGARRTVIQKAIGKWDPAQHEQPVCAPAVWQRGPVRVRMQPTGGATMEFEVVGATSSLIEEGDSGDDQ